MLHSVLVLLLCGIAILMGESEALVPMMEDQTGIAMTPLIAFLERYGTECLCGGLLILGLLHYLRARAIPVLQKALDDSTSQVERTTSELTEHAARLEELEASGKVQRVQLSTLEEQLTARNEELATLKESLVKAEAKARQMNDPDSRDARIDAELVNLLSLLQEKARFMDFVMDDITQYQDTQVGAAARVVHQGCRALINEYFSISPVHKAQEGEEVALEKNYQQHDYRLIGNVGTEPPFKGRLLHKGWRVDTIQLPRIATSAEEVNARVIAPAEIELR